MSPAETCLIRPNHLLNHQPQREGVNPFITCKNNMWQGCSCFGLGWIGILAAEVVIDEQVRAFDIRDVNVINLNNL